MGAMASHHVHVLMDYTDDQVLCRNCGWVRRVNKAGRPKCSVAKREQRGGPATRAGRSAHLEWINSHPRECSLCGTAEHLEVDHDHSHCPGMHGCSDCIRGTVCKKCNARIASVEALAKAGQLAPILKWIGVS